MKKIYLQPQIECIAISADWSLCNGGPSTSTDTDDSGFPFAPQRQAPAF